MRFRGLLFLLVTFMAVGTWVMAADEQSTSQPQVIRVNPDASTGHDALIPDFSSQSGLPGYKVEMTDRFAAARKGASMILRIPRDPGMPIDPEALMNGGVCYTMRTYMVKPSERLADNESGFRGYSSCQLASTYRFRWADSPRKAGAKLK